jgi:glutathione peroxidase
MKKVWIFLASGAVIFALKSCIFSQSKSVPNPAAVQPTSDFHSLKLTSLDGKDTLHFSSLKGKKVLIVNTASECGYTPQYEELEKLKQTMKDSLVIIGCPCNQFGGQEPGSAEQIQSFCQKNYGVSFFLSEKLDVKGDKQHPVYQWLTQKNQNGALDASVNWNFNKFLLDENGFLLEHFGSNTSPLDKKLVQRIRD